MTMIRTIVAATDFSPGSHAAVERAVQLAKRMVHRCACCMRST